MPATAISLFKTHQATWEVSVLPGQSSAIEPLLGLAMVEVNAQGAYIYRFDRENISAILAAFAGPVPDHAGPGGTHEVRGRIAALHWSRTSPLVLETRAAADWRFGRIPEFQTGRFEGVVSVPLLDSGEVVGLANFCRTAGVPLSGGALAFAMSLSLPLGALLVAASLRRQLEKANQDLAASSSVHSKCACSKWPGRNPCA